MGNDRQSVAASGEQAAPAANRQKGGIRASVLLAGSVGLLALPSAVLAFTTRFDPPSAPAPIEAVDAESGSARFARALSIHSSGKEPLFPFTPAGNSSHGERSFTVAVRVDSAAAQAITVRGPVAPPPEPDTSRIRIAPTAFNLGVSRGYHNFAQDLVPDQRKGISELPDINKFSLAPEASGSTSRFSARTPIDASPPAQRSSRTFTGDGNQLDVGGAYRLTDHFDVTAGVRYSQDQERIAPLTDGRQDSQAVYVGTQVHF